MILPDLYMGHHQIETILFLVTAVIDVRQTFLILTFFDKRFIY